jgi:hypothetical protein
MLSRTSCLLFILPQTSPVHRCNFIFTDFFAVCYQNNALNFRELEFRVRVSGKFFREGFLKFSIQFVYGNVKLEDESMLQFLTFRPPACSFAS